MNNANEDRPMSMKGSDSTNLREIDRWDSGAGWIAYPDEGMERASHALVDDDDVWLVDPVDADDLDEFLAELGEVVGVLVLLDRHKRDAATIANRHDVSVHRPPWMDSIDSDIDAPVTSLGGTLGETGYRVRKRIDLPVWKEAVLYRPDDGTLLVPESIGTADMFCTAGERLGVHPVLRFTPPNDLADLSVDRLLVGHGPGIQEDAMSTIREAISESRSGALSLYQQMISERIG
jgi:hypothetical protein